MNEKLFSEAVAKGLSISELSREFGKSKGSIRHWLSKFDLKTLNPRPQNLTGKKCECRLCGRLYSFERKKGHTTTTCNSCALSNRRKAMKKRLVVYKGGSCEKCGYNQHIEVLDFHHTNPEKKNFNFAVSYSKSWEELQEEADQCRLLCANCHREEHLIGT